MKRIATKRNTASLNIKNKIWFDNECTQKRTVFRKWKRRAKAREGCDEAKKAKAGAFRAYKKSLTRKYRCYVKGIQNKIRNLKTSDTRSYWKLINGDNHQKQNIMNNISHETFAKHFENLCNVQNDNLQDINPDIDDSIQNEPLNTSITEEEVIKCILKLKNNKASGHDGILNEFLKHSSVKLVNVITTLFKVILTTHIIFFVCKL